MSVSMQVEFRGEAKIVRRLEQLRGKTGNLRPVMRDIADALESSTQERFITQTDPNGKTWERHSKATEVKRGTGADKLRDRNHLYDSITSSSSDDQAAVGTNMVYARVHQLGGEAGRKSARVKIPARPYLGLSRDDKEEVLALIEDHLQEGAQ